MTSNFHLSMEHIKATSNKFRTLMKENIRGNHFYISSLLINKNIMEPDQIFKKHTGFGKGRL